MVRIGYATIATQEEFVVMLPSLDFVNGAEKRVFQGLRHRHEFWRGIFEFGDTERRLLATFLAMRNITPENHDRRGPKGSVEFLGTRYRLEIYTTNLRGRMQTPALPQTAFNEVILQSQTATISHEHLNQENSSTSNVMEGRLVGSNRSFMTFGYIHYHSHLCNVVVLVPLS